MGIFPKLIPLEAAIGRMEGYGASPTNRPTRLNNPGDLEFHSWMADPKYGAVLETPRPLNPARFAKFPTVAQGMAALRTLLVQHYGNNTIAELITAYAPPVENPTEEYIRNVCAWTGLLRSSLVKDAIKLV